MSLLFQEILLVLDGTTGLNMLPQAREFNEVKMLAFILSLVATIDCFVFAQLIAFLFVILSYKGAHDALHGRLMNMGILLSVVSSFIL